MTHLKRSQKFCCLLQHPLPFQNRHTPNWTHPACLELSNRGGEAREGAGVGIGLHGAAQIRDALAVVILQPQGGVDVARGGRGAHDAPVGAVKVLPGQLFAVVDLGGKLLTLIGGTAARPPAPSIWRASWFAAARRFSSWTWTLRATPPATSS